MLEGAFTQIYVAADGVQLDVHPPIPARSGEQPESHSFFSHPLCFDAVLRKSSYSAEHIVI